MSRSPEPAGTVDAVTASEEGLRELRFPLPQEPVHFFRPESGIGTAPFWEGAAAGELRLVRCSACHVVVHPPGPRCPRCGSTAVAWEPMSGRGTLYAWTVSLQAFLPGLPPYCIALVQLAEQDDVRLTSQLVDASVADLRVGLPVEVLFVDGVDGLRLPFFRPVRR